MARLPQPGGDRDNWGVVLNDFLTQSLNSDGTIKSGAVTATHVADDTITTAKLQDNAVTDAKVSSGAAIAQSKIANLTTDLAGKAAATHTHTASQISDSTTTGRSVMTATDAAAARTAPAGPASGPA